VADRNGDLQDLSFRFAQTEGGLTGKIYQDNESIAITDGKLDGDHITFMITTELNGSITKTVYTGTLVDGVIQLTRKKAGDKDKPEKSAPILLKRL